MHFTGDRDFSHLPIDSLGLLALTGAWPARNWTHGFVPDLVIEDISRGCPEAAQPLVDCGWWERAEGGYQFVDWAAWSPETVGERPDPMVIARALKLRESAIRRQALFRNAKLRLAVRDRDADTCRYCGRHVSWGRGRPADAGTYDHVDPEGPNALENLVVACRSCNAKKNRRTPEQAGMKLLPPPSRRPASPAAPEAEGLTESDKLPSPQAAQETA